MRPGVALAAGLLTAAAVVALDVVAGSDTVITTALVLAPFVTAMLGPPRETILVALVAILLAALSGIWNHNFGESDYFLRLAIVVAGDAVAIIAVSGRLREEAARERFRVLMEAARVVDDALSLEQTVDRLSALIVPGLADFCIFDLSQGDGIHRLQARASGPRAAELEEALRERCPPRQVIEVGAFGSSQGRLIPAVSIDHLCEPSDEGPDPQITAALVDATAIVVPLRARGRTFGVLTLVVGSSQSDRPYDAADLEFVQLLSGRVGLALDNAGLFTELATAEAQLTAVLGSLAEAVTVQSARGGLVYANAAAAEALGFDSPEQLLSMPPERIVDRYESYHEDGSPLRMEELPGRRVLAGEEAPPLVVRAIEKATGEERWRVIKGTGVRDREGNVELAVNIIEDITEVKMAERAQALLARVGEVLASSLDYEHTLQRLAELAVPDLSDWCGVSIPSDDGLIKQVAVAHVDPAKVEFARQLSESYPVRADEPGGTAAVIREGTTQLITDITDEMIEAAARDERHLQLIRRLGMRAALIVPMTTPTGTTGALTLVSAESGRTFSAADVELAEEVARRAGAAVENARLYTERSHIARTLQRGLLPPDLPEMPGWAAATLYRPAGRENWVGGDFYDVFAVEDGWMLVVGDVVGHGPGAAALTAEARYTLRTAGTLTGSSVIALNQLNRGLFQRDPGMALCTAACVTLRESGGSGWAEIVCAGHPLPLLVRDGGVEAVGEPGAILGAWEEREWAPVSVPLEPDDVLVLYTDGVVDAEGEGERFGERRLRDALAGARDANEAVRLINRELSEFEVGEQSDDTAVLAVSRVQVAESVAAAEPARRA